MNIEEYKKIKDYNYDDYCKYLQEKAKFKDHLKGYLFII